jgi:hypothetical protein
MNQITQFYKSIKSIGVTDDDAKVVLNHILQETLEDWNKKPNGEFIEIDGERVFAVEWADIIATIMDCSYPELRKKYLNRHLSPEHNQQQPRT